MLALFVWTFTGVMNAVILGLFALCCLAILGLFCLEKTGNWIKKIFNGGK